MFSTRIDGNGKNWFLKIILYFTENTDIFIIWIEGKSVKGAFVDSGGKRMVQ